MTDLIIPRPRTLQPARRAPMLERFLRRAFFERLEGLAAGRITIQDGEHTRTFGADDSADGARVLVHDPRFYRSIVLGGSLGAAEAYVDGFWSADDLTRLLRIMVRNVDSADRLEGGASRLLAPLAKLAHAIRADTRRGSRRNIHAHYDLGNDFFSLFLDETLTYSCAVFEPADASLAEASVEKLDRICRKLQIRPDDHLLEIGAGWGSFALHAAGRYGCRVTTTTISREQHDLAQRRIRDAGLSDRVEVLQRDYRDLDGRFDHVVSIEMIEAVGHRFIPTFFASCSRRLRPGGRLALQAITMPDQRYDQYLRSVDFIRRDVFPGSCVPSLQVLVNAAAGATDMRLVGLEDITPHYATTLRRWRERFVERLPEVRALGYSDAFIRLWGFYLCYCEAGFAERYTGTVQLLFDKPGGGTRS